MWQITCSKEKSSTLFSVLLLFAALITVSCSPSSRSLFFDIPPSKPKPEVIEESPVEKVEDDNRGFSFKPVTDSKPAPLEDATTWEQALAMLPQDYKKDADWSAAVRQGLVRPRPGEDPLSQYATIFKYDFIIENEKPKNEAYFPHSAHTEWLGCQNCHVSLYPYKRNPASMKEMRNGASCGACHGKVAFSLKQCKRCHLQR